MHPNIYADHLSILSQKFGIRDKLEISSCRHWLEHVITIFYDVCWCFFFLHLPFKCSQKWMNDDKKMNTNKRWFFNLLFSIQFGGLIPRYFFVFVQRIFVVNVKIVFALFVNVSFFFFFSINICRKHQMDVNVPPDLHVCIVVQRKIKITCVERMVEPIKIRK